MNIRNIKVTPRFLIEREMNEYRVKVETDKGTMRGTFNARSTAEAIGFAIIEVAKRTAYRIEEN